jgi:hypothetical protein
MQAGCALVDVDLEETLVLMVQLGMLTRQIKSPSGLFLCSTLALEIVMQYFVCQYSVRMEVEK